MPRRAMTVFAVTGALVLIVVMGIVVLGRGEGSSIPSEPAPSKPIVPPTTKGAGSPLAATTPSSPEPPSRTQGNGSLARGPESSPRARDEASLMGELRRLVKDDPTAALELAREANRRFPGSADAPERGWVIVKSLASMGRFEEARNEAQTMVDTYRNTPWAADVKRHLLTNPLTHPSERGYSER